MGVADRSLTTAFKEVSNMAAKLNLPKSIVVSDKLCDNSCDASDMITPVMPVIIIMITPVIPVILMITPPVI